MKAITKKVSNLRLKLDLNLHIINETFVVSNKEGIVRGQIQSFKTDKVVDSINEQNGQLQPALISPFEIKIESYDKLDEQIEKYINDEIESIVSR